MVTKIRPYATAEWTDGNDGYDGHYYISYRCPTCHRVIGRSYKSETACDECGTFYDWGDKEPRIVVTRSVEW